MKKRILFNSLMGVSALTAIAPVMTSCTSTVDTKVLTASFARKYVVGDTLAKDEITLKLDNETVAPSEWKLYANGKEIQTYKFTNTNKVEFTGKYGDKTIWFDIAAQEGEDQSYEKDNTYLCEQRFINTEVNAFSHNVRFELKQALKDGQTLVAKITEDPESGTGLLTDQTVDLTNFTFDSIFYVPVQAKTTYVKKTAITKFSIEVNCVNTSGKVVWTDTYRSMYIRFVAVNALPGTDYRLQTIDIANMDNAYINTRYSELRGQYRFPLQIELREQIPSAKNLHAIVYNQRAFIDWATPTDKFSVDMEAPDGNGLYYNWIRRWSSERKVHNFDWDFIASDYNIVHDLTETAWNISYTMLMEFTGDTSVMKQGSFVTFDFVLYLTNADGSKISWYENFSGCKMKFIPMGSDNN